MNKQAYYIYKAASIMKLADTPRYTEEEFNNLADQYKRDKFGDMPDATSADDMFNYRLDERQSELDDANRRLSKAVGRANGFGPIATGLGGLAGFGIGGWIADRINGREPLQEKYDDTEAWKKAHDKWKKDWWKRMLIGGAFRGGGFLLGGLTPYLLSRSAEGVWDLGSAGVRAAGNAYNRYAGGRR